MTPALACLTLLAPLAWGPPITWATVAKEEINESSGLAASRTWPGELYTHNDSGDTARFFAVNSKGEVTGEWSLEGVRATDWEDMATFRWRGTNWVLLADVGDNGRRRRSIEMHLVVEPKTRFGKLTPALTLSLTYPNKAHDCEAVFVDPLSGDLFVVTKEAGVGGVYTFPKLGAALEAKRQNPLLRAELVKVGEIKVETPGIGGRLITGGDMSPDGSLVALRTYREGLVFAVSGKNRKWWEQTPSKATLADERQGETICFSLDGKSLFTSSEGTPLVITQIKRK